MFSVLGPMARSCPAAYSTNAFARHRRTSAALAYKMWAGQLRSCNCEIVRCALTGVGCLGDLALPSSLGIGQQHLFPVLIIHGAEPGERFLVAGGTAGMPGPLPQAPFD